MTLKIYTKVGDHGYTKQVSGKMVPKYDLQIESLGAIDELQSYLGVVIASLSQNCAELKNELINRQRELYLLQADIVVARKHAITAKTVTQLEKRIDQIQDKFPKIPEFILPGGGITGAHLQYARTLARRTERIMVKYSNLEEPLDEACLKYINRLSDYLFTLARYANHLDGVNEIKSKA